MSRRQGQSIVKGVEQQHLRKHRIIAAAAAAAASRKVVWLSENGTSKTSFNFLKHALHAPVHPPGCTEFSASLHALQAMAAATASTCSQPQRHFKSLLHATGTHQRLHSWPSGSVPPHASICFSVVHSCHAGAGSANSLPATLAGACMHRTMFYQPDSVSRRVMFAASQIWQASARQRTELSALVHGAANDSHGVVHGMAAQAAGFHDL